MHSGETWSVAHQPTLKRATKYEAIFSLGRAEFRRVDGSIETHVEISVSPEEDVELRRVSITNRSRETRTIDVTSYAEVVLAAAAADASHPAFSNLFVQTELLEAQQAILCTRRPRSGTETPPWLLHVMTVHGPTVGPASFETSRDAFIGRGRTAADPVALSQAHLTGTAGAVLDPVVAVRNRIVIKPHQRVQLHIVTGMCETREAALATVEKYVDRHAAARVLELAWTHNQVLLRRLDTTETDVQIYERLASNVLFSSRMLRASEGVVARNRRGQSGLWGYGISGDLPIVLVRISDIGEVLLVRHMLMVHGYWREKGLLVDLVIWNEDPSGYRQELQDRIAALVSLLTDVNLIDKPGGVFLRRGEQMSEEDKVLIQTVARVIVTDTAGPLVDQVEKIGAAEKGTNLFPARDRRATMSSSSSSSSSTSSLSLSWSSTSTAASSPLEPSPLPSDASTAAGAPGATLAAFNGLGGFTQDGREYVITTDAMMKTPAPWVNVIANPWLKAAPMFHRSGLGNSTRTFVDGGSRFQRSNSGASSRRNERFGGVARSCGARGCFLVANFPSTRPPSWWSFPRGGWWRAS